MNNIKQKLTALLTVAIAKLKFITKIKFVKKIFAALGMATVATTAVNSAAVTLTSDGAISTTGNYVAADINATSDTVTNTADAVVIIDGVNTNITFNTPNIILFSLVITLGEYSPLVGAGVVLKSPLLLLSLVSLLSS